MRLGVTSCTLWTPNGVSDPAKTPTLDAPGSGSFASALTERLPVGVVYPPLALLAFLLRKGAEARKAVGVGFAAIRVSELAAELQPLTPGAAAGRTVVPVVISHS